MSTTSPGRLSPLAVHQAVRVVGRVPANVQVASHVIGGLQLASPEVAVYLFVLPEAQHPYGYASYLAMSLGDELVLRGVDFYDVAFFGLSLYAGDGSREHPRVKAFQRFFFSGFQVCFVHVLGLHSMLVVAVCLLCGVVLYGVVACLFQSFQLVVDVQAGPGIGRGVLLLGDGELGGFPV